MGDTVQVYDDKEMYKKRVMTMTYYPYENKQPTVTIGLPSTRNAFFQAWQKSKLFKSIQRNTARGNRWKTTYFTGTVNSTQNPVQSENKQLLLDGDLLYIKDDNGVRRINIGNIGKEFAFELYDKKGKRNVYINENGDIIISGTLDTGKDCRIQGELRVGMAGNNTKGIEFYGDTYSGEQSTCYGKLVPGVDANDDHIRGINVVDGEFWVKGYKAATERDISALQSTIETMAAQIEKLQKEIDTLV